MGKIKLNLVSGAVVEKPLINAFKANNSNYVVLDNEINGSMGLPIILVCKFENNKLIKIVDQNEWNIVKEYLKNIIAGNQIEFIKISNELVADDIYYTQLTLPVPSYDALKNAYKVAEEPIIENVVSSVATDVSTEAEVSPVSVSPVVEPIVQNVQEPVVNVEPVVDIPVNSQVVNPTVEVNVPPVEPMVSPVDIVPPVDPLAVVNPTAVIEPVVQNPVIEPTVQSVQEPIVPSVETPKEESIFMEQKEAFMQACENMFDALVQKFERELENRK